MWYKTEEVKKYYDRVVDFYGTKKARRSQIPLINHIDEGLKLLSWLGCSEDTKSAFCVHPLFQDDKSFSKLDVSQMSPYVVMLATEYRNVANSYLPKDYSEEHVIKLSF